MEWQGGREGERIKWVSKVKDVVDSCAGLVLLRLLMLSEQAE